MAQAGGIAPTVDAAAFQQHKEFLQGFFRDEQVRARAILENESSWMIVPLPPPHCCWQPFMSLNLRP
jgi:Zn/Cd-binding protein ZinT